MEGKRPPFGHARYIPQMKLLGRIYQVCMCKMTINTIQNLPTRFIQTFVLIMLWIYNLTDGEYR